MRALNPLLHSQLRLAIISILMGVKQADFNYLLDKTGATRGNLSVQISKLKEAGYLSVDKTFKNNYPLTTCRISKKGIKAFEEYVEALQGYIDIDGQEG